MALSYEKFYEKAYKIDIDSQPYTRAEAVATFIDEIKTFDTEQFHDDLDEASKKTPAKVKIKTISKTHKDKSTSKYTYDFKNKLWKYDSSAGGRSFSSINDNIKQHIDEYETDNIKISGTYSEYIEEISAKYFVNPYHVIINGHGHLNSFLYAIIYGIVIDDYLGNEVFNITYDIKWDKYGNITRYYVYEEDFAYANTKAFEKTFNKLLEDNNITVDCSSLKTLWQKKTTEYTVKYYKE